MKKKNSSVSLFSVFLVIVVLAVMMIGDGMEETGTVFASLAVVILITAVVLVIEKAKARKKASVERRPADPRMETFTKPDAPCIVCDHTGEDHLERDKRNRIRQLDDWLKSGLIDRAEYAVLKDRFERDM